MVLRKLLMKGPIESIVLEKFLIQIYNENEVTAPDGLKLLGFFSYNFRS
jgi:hypothetical protein